MEKTTIFFLGILGGLILFGISYIFLGMLKIFRKQKNDESFVKDQINDIRLEIHGLQLNLSTSIKELDDSLENSNNRIWKYIDQMEGDVNKKNEDSFRYIDSRIDKMVSEVNKKNEEAFRYIDSRIDKTRDSIFSTIEVLSEKKDKVIGVSDEI